MRKILLACAIFALAAIAEADSRPKFDPPWAVSWDAALEQAKERNVPIVVSFHQDG